MNSSWTLVFCLQLFLSMSHNVYQSTVIPIINLKDNDAEIASNLFSAATQYGFFYLIGHDLPIEIKRNLLDEAKNFFNLNDSIKYDLELKIGESYGYTPFESETLNQTVSKYGDTKESFYVCDDKIKYGDNHGFMHKNAWPSSDLLPNFKETTMNYIDSITALGYKMNEYLALSLNLSRNYFNIDAIFGDKPQNALRMIHYLPIASNIEIGRFGAGQHTDYGILTFLVTDGNPGLQILHNNQWIDVSGIENNNNEPLINEPVIIVNIGDELQRITNDHYKSTKHRVVIKQAKDRYSAAFFWEPNLDAIMKCVETICDEDDGSKELPKYEPITHRQHLTKKFAEAYNTVNINKNEL